MNLNCTCFRVRRLSRQVTQLYDAALRPTGMRVTQFSLLSALDKYGGMTVTDLAHVLGSDATSMSRALGAIVAQGWVIVGPGKDKRSKSVSLTKAGLEALKGAKPYWHDAQQQLVHVVGAERRAQLETLVDQVFNEISGT